MRPAPALIGAFVVLAGLGLAVALGQISLAPWLMAHAVVLVIATLDAFVLVRWRTPLAQRDVAGVLPLGQEREVGIDLRPADARPVRVDVHDGHPAAFRVSGLPQRLDLAPAATTRIVYRAAADERGSYHFTALQLRLHSPMRLWTQRRFIDLPATVRVYPNFSPLTRLALFGTDQASRAIGAHLRRRRGDGTEFQQLRDYRDGDNLRQIDWKASRRAQRLISREYREERNQHVILMLDTGRRMLARDGALSHFDHALNACLVLALIALRQGDAVGLIAHGGDSRCLRPARGIGTLDALLANTFDLQPRAVATDYLAAASELATRHPRRALVVLVTNIRDEDVEDLVIAVRQLRRRHVVIIASLREKALDQARDLQPQHIDDAILVGATALYLEDRRRAHETLRAHGARVLDVDSDALPAALVERYLDVKREGLL